LPAGLSYVEISGGALHALARLSDGTLASWGFNGSGQCNVPGLPAGVVFSEVSAGTFHTLARCSDGSVLAWGDNSHSQCNVPVLPAGLTYVEIAGGDDHSVARRSDGSVVGWGTGAGSVPLLPAGQTYVQIASGDAHSLARRSDGSVVGWGNNTLGQCDAPALPPGWQYVEIAAGGRRSLALAEGPPSPTSVCEPGAAGVLACPCSNPPAGLGRGCDNEQATGGASLTAAGLSRLSLPTLSFTTAGENATVGSVLIQGTQLSTGVTFGHGVRCTAGLIKRLYVKVAVGGSITAPELPSDADIPARSAALGDTILAGQKRWYQVYYRDTTLLLPGCPLPASQFNVTNALEATWVQ
jgi:hypothetical protein